MGNFHSEQERSSLLITFDNCISSVLIQNAYRNIKYRQQ
ncbi:hypothetical protein HWC92_gp06 [Flavobacterium phage vB_FspS_morran9-1]|uniref:Uncharacterized protein n=11 Tax=Lillamyvirus TaxID=2843418 RepID=A0A6B9LAM7_9CAUD|nr:hypothetical protein HWC91_gp06 [Flavobacterium phage vB_FspS_lillamy9-1]YP_009854934.1 hypothetical protein HWC92_gp06 [Flavobacterium phage vB_FspS_morran9-1]YP_009855141.1 hypothetical protein HWC95_gp05 [Flavobacterium phage vB_FspS_sniff9-1]YP_009855216.1 hypothetical protein HWC96_gp06 [Flavobacterium phage vB_FspS_snork6-1]QHB39107.1 hypothetical protein lillamy92_gp006 [Flavobacterium phage vB_FspS_lillamy9-2]QHB39182.1 hypothetical protein lillamy93_gp008 [Flavobacterium phage vB_F